MARKIRFSLIAAGVVLTFAGSSLVAGTPAVAASARPIVQVTSVGGFVAPSWQASRLPQLLISSDGTAIVENQKPAHSYVRQALALKLSNSTVKSFLGKFSTALQTPQGGWGMPPVADMPNARVQAVINGTRLDVTIDAFSYLGNGLTPAQLKARKTLTVLLNGLESSVTRAKQAYKPAKYEIWGLTQVMDNGGVGIANPASVYCASIGGTTNIVDSGNGQVGYCQLPSGENVEEWANFRSAMATLPAWPEKLALPSDPNNTGMSCSAVSAAAISKQLANKDDGGRWLLPSGQALPVVLRPILPGESACHRSW